MNEIQNELQAQGFLEPAKWVTSATNLQSLKNAKATYFNQPYLSNMNNRNQEDELEILYSYLFK